MPFDEIKLVTSIAMHYQGTPYKWGGDDPILGFDCSGFVIELLKSVGRLPREGDWKACQIYDYFSNRLEPVPFEGCLVFYQVSQDDNRICHVEYCLNDYVAIGASGGFRNTTNIKIAIDQNALIKIRPITSRKDIHSFVNPFSGKRRYKHVAA